MAKLNTMLVELWVAPWCAKVERADDSCIHVTLPTKAEWPVYECRDHLVEAGYKTIVYQVGDHTKPQIGVFSRIDGEKQ